MNENKLCRKTSPDGDALIIHDLMRVQMQALIPFGIPEYFVFMNIIFVFFYMA